MATDNVCQWPDRDELRNLPVVRHQFADWAHAGKYDHHGNHGNAPDKRHLELSDDGRDLLEKRSIGRLLGGGAPGHVDAKEMAEDGLGDVDGNAAEEGCQNEEPFGVLEYCEWLALYAMSGRNGKTNMLQIDSVPPSGSGE